MQEFDPGLKRLPELPTPLSGVIDVTFERLEDAARYQDQQNFDQEIVELTGMIPRFTADEHERITAGLARSERPAFRMVASNMIADIALMGFGFREELMTALIIDPDPWVANCAADAMCKLDDADRNIVPFETLTRLDQAYRAAAV